MDYFDKKINDLYNHPDQEVPSDLAWENMEEGIYAQMQDKKSKCRGLWLWLSGGLFLIILLASILSFLTDENKTTKNILVQNNKNSINQNTETAQVRSNSIATKESKKLSLSNPNEENQNSIAVESHSTNTNSLIKNQTTNNQTKTLTPSQKTSKDYSNIDQDELNIQTPINANVINYNKEVKSEKVRLQSPAEHLSISQINSIAANIFLYQRELIENPKILHTVSSTFDQTIQQNTKYSLSLLGGTTLNSGYKIDKGDTQFHSSLPGYNIRLALAAQKENGWGFTFGIGHSLLVEKFDLDLIDSISIVRNVLVQSLTNSITGSVSHNHADTNIIGIRDRRELSYNTINTLSLDASIFKSIDLGEKWSLAPKVGLQYSRIIDIKGKALDAEGDIISYDNSNNSIHKNLMSGALGLGINYKLSKKFYLSVDLSQTLSWNKLYAEGSQLNITYIRGGVTYRL